MAAGVDILDTLFQSSVCSAAGPHCKQEERLKEGKCEKCPVCSRGEGLTEVREGIR